MVLYQLLGSTEIYGSSNVNDESWGMWEKVTVASLNFSLRFMVFIPVVWLYKYFISFPLIIQ
jgi:hypothetical protein